MLNPLFAPPDDNQDPLPTDDRYILQHRHAGKLEPINKDLQHSQQSSAAPQPHNPAVELIRQKVAALYAEEPSAAKELAAPEPPEPQRSPHQQFMHELSTSGKPLAHIQTAWHNYYTQLSSEEKHAVWREFYAANARHDSPYAQFRASQPAPQKQTSYDAPVAVVLPSYPVTSRPVVAHHSNPPEEPVQKKPKKKPQLPAVLHKAKQHVLKRVRASEKAQTKAKQHVQSLLFGLGTGCIVLIIFLFGFFNEMIIAPFIQPSRHVSATPIIVNADSVAPSETPEIIIPKINVQIPVVYGETSIVEADVQNALEKGVIHYPTTVLPGQQGNAAFFGHSSNNIFNKGKYKFAFVLLRQLAPGDIFYLTYDKKVYSYRVFDKKIVAPSEVSVLGTVPGKAATAALITCDPPGTSTNRLVVWGEQISPDPSGAATAAPPPTTPSTPTDTTPIELPSEGPTLWSRMWNSIF